MQPHAKSCTEAQVVILVGYDEQPAREMISHSVPNGLLSISTYPTVYYTLLHFYNHGYDNFILLYRKLYEGAIEAFLSFLEQIVYNYDMSWSILPICYEDTHESVYALHKLDLDGKLSCENVIVVRSACFTTVVPSLYLKAHRDTDATVTVVLSDVSIEKKETAKLKKCKDGCFAIFSNTMQHNPPIDLLRLSIDTPELVPDTIQSIYQEIISYNSIYNSSIPEHRRTFKNRYLPLLQLPDARIQEIARSLDDADNALLKGIQEILLSNLPHFSSSIGTMNYFQLMGDSTKIRIPFSAIQDSSRMRAYTQPPGIIIIARELIRYLHDIGRVWSLFSDLIPFLVEQQNLPSEAQHPNIRAYLKMTPDINLCMHRNSETTSETDVDIDVAKDTMSRCQSPSVSLQPSTRNSTDGGYDLRGAHGFSCSFATYSSMVIPTTQRGLHLNKELWSHLERDCAKERLIKTIRQSLDEEFVVKSLSDKLKAPRKIVVTGFEITNERYSSIAEKAIGQNNRNFPTMHCLVTSRDIYLCTHLAIKNNLYIIPAWIPLRRNRSNSYMINYSYKPESAAGVATSEKASRDIIIDNVMFNAEHRSKVNPYGPNGIAALQHINDITAFDRAIIGDHTHLVMSVIGPSCKIGEKVHISNCILGPGVTIHHEVTLKKCIIFSNATIRQGCDLENCTVLDGAEVQEFTASQDTCYRACRNAGGAVATNGRS